MKKFFASERFGERRVVWNEVRQSGDEGGLPAFGAGNDDNLYPPEDVGREKGRTVLERVVGVLARIGSTGDFDASRRALIQTGVAGAALALLGGAALAEAMTDEDLEKNLRDILKKYASEIEIRPYMSGADLASAGVVAGMFAAIISGCVANKIILSEKTARAMLYATLGRHLTLRTMGDDRDHEISKNELASLAFDMIPVAILTGLSDITTSALKIDLDEIFKWREDKRLHQKDYSNPERPINLDLETWRAYKESVNDDLATTTHTICNAAMVLAPLGTTYTSSALADAKKDDVFRMLFEQEYAKQTIKCIEEGSDPIPANIKALAKKYAEEKMNGRFGFGKLTLTYAANGNGPLGLGDPPEVYYAKSLLSLPEGHDAWSHFWHNQLIGILASTASTVVATNLWLNNIGAYDSGKAKLFWKDMAGTLASAVIKGGEKVGKPVFEAIGAIKKKEALDRAVIEKLQQEGEDLTGLGAILSRVDGKTYSLGMARYCRAKAVALGHIAEHFDKYRDKYFGILNKLGGVGEKGVEMLKWILDIGQGYERIDPPEVGHLQELGEHMGEINEVGEELGRLLSAVRAATQEGEGDDEEEVEVDEAEVASVAEKYKKIKLLVGRFAPEKSGEIAGDVRKKLRIPDDASEDDIKEALENAQTAIVRDALRHVAEEIHPDEPDAVEGLGEHDDHQHSSHLLTHAAKEVLFALLTQIPAVFPLQRLIVNGLAPKKKTEFSDGDIAEVDDLTEKVEREESEWKQKLKTELREKVQKIKGGLAPVDLDSIEKFVDGFEEKPGRVEMGKKIIDFIIEISDSLTPNKLIKAIYILCGADIGMSSVADNVAAYLMSEGVMIDLFKRTFGEDIFQKEKDLFMNLKILMKLLAELAGALTKIANGPNFSQTKLICKDSDANGQGFVIDREEFEFQEAMYHNNGFAMAVNGLAYLGVTTYLSGQVKRLASESGLVA